MSRKYLKLFILNIRAIVFRNWVCTIFLLAFIALIINFIVFFPGYMSNDSILMYYVARGDVPSDLAPVMLGLVWRVLYSLTGQASSLLFMQLTMLWLSLALLSVFIFKKTNNKKLSLLILFIGCLPFVFNISGVIWRDCQMAFSLLLAFSITLWQQEVRKLWLRISMLTISLILILYAAVSRYNAIIAVVPMIFLAIRASGFIKKTYLQIIIAFLSIPLVFLVLFPSINNFVSATKSNNSPGIFLDDIIRTSNKEELDKISMPNDLRVNLLKVQDCSYKKDRLIDNIGFCADDEIRTVFYQNHSEFKKIWLQVITNNPFSYIKYKANMYLNVLFPVKSYIYVWQDGIVPNKYNVEIRFDVFRVIGFAYTNFFSRYMRALFEPWFWLLSGIIIMYKSIKKASKYKLVINTLCISGILYILGYAITGVAPDFRYIYWSVLAIIFAFVLYKLDISNSFKKQV